ncbi:MAG: sulfur carrier protein ThiS [Chitinophagales bacterium]|nr:sulfur carrier protein ThiS [Chitinophagales bacterium]
MKLKVNNEPVEFNEELNLQALLQKLLLIEKNGIAVAVNASVFLKKNWNQFLLNENDEVIIIEAAQGG